MNIQITHVAKSDPSNPNAPIFEVGAMEGSNVIWRCPLDVAISRLRADVHFFIESEGERISVEISPPDLYHDAYLRTAVDGPTRRLLTRLPQLPHKTPGRLF